MKTKKAEARHVGPIDLEKADTVSGAMKQLAREMKSFKIYELLAKVAEDPDWKKLLDAAGESSPYSAVAYWASTGKLKKVGDGKEAVYTVVDL